MFKIVARVIQVICILVSIACVALWGYEWAYPSTASLKYGASQAMHLATFYLTLIILIQVVLENRKLRGKDRA